MKGAAFPFPLPPSPWGMLVMFAVATALMWADATTTET